MTATISDAGCKPFSSFSALDAEEEEKKAEVTTERVLEAIEEAYPNSLTIDDMSRYVVIMMHFIYITEKGN
jgi:hypothetical protein